LDVMLECLNYLLMMPGLIALSDAVTADSLAAFASVGERYEFESPRCVVRWLLEAALSWLAAFIVIVQLPNRINLLNGCPKPRTGTY
jgi:hypothetical protein